MIKNISGKTKIVGVIGFPIEHTLSPVMHNTAFKNLKLNYIYIPFKVEPKNLKYAIKALKVLNIVGLNVTIPHKTNVISYLNNVDKLAREIGAVNTILNKDGKLFGYNTDAYGFIESLKKNNFNLKGKNGLILGAGGASKAVCFALVYLGVNSLTISNRTLYKAKNLVKKIKKYNSNIELKYIPFEQKILSKLFLDVDFAVNTTSIGMYPNINDTPVEKFKIPSSNFLVYDLIYIPFKTKFLKTAEKFGARTINGLDMFVFQGAKAFEIWTGIKPPIELMSNAIKNELRNVFKRS
jgi:shikimate dehydrogenase